MIPAICLEPLHPELLTEEKIPRIAAAGFRHVEFWGWRDKNIPSIQAACRKHDVQVVNFSGHRTGSPIAEKTHPVLFADVSDAVPTARTLGCQTLMLLTNALNPDHEPGTGSVDWAAMLRLIRDRGYTGCVGFEYFPESDSDSSLEAIRNLWEANIAVRC